VENFDEYILKEKVQPVTETITEVIDEQEIARLVEEFISKHSDENGNLDESKLEQTINEGLVV